MESKTDSAGVSVAAPPSPREETRSYLGLPWRLVPHERGFEIKSGAAWTWILDDSIGHQDRSKEGAEFLSDQKRHAEFLIHAANCHHDLLEALKAARRDLWDNLHSGMSEAQFGDEFDYIDAAIAKATDSAATPAPDAK